MFAVHPRRPGLHRRRHGEVLLPARQECSEPPVSVHRPVPGHHGRLRIGPEAVPAGEQWHQALDPGNVESKVMLLEL